MAGVGGLWQKPVSDLPFTLLAPFCQAHAGLMPVNSISIQLKSFDFWRERISAQRSGPLEPQVLFILFLPFQRRVVLLTQEMDAGLQAWKLRQQKLEEERKQEHGLKPKGISLRSPLPRQ